MKAKKWLDKFQTWVWLKFSDTIYGSKIGDLPDKFMYFFGVLNILSILTIFLTITILGYTSAKNSPYLVPKAEDGSSDDNKQSCDSVSREVPRGIYVADTNGKYLGESGFLYSQAIYDIGMNNLNILYGEYKETVEDVKKKMDRLAKVSKGYDLSRNLITYLALKLVYADSDSNLQTFSLTADIEGVFSSKAPGECSVVIQNRNSNCNITRTSNFDMGSFSLQGGFSYQEYSNSNNCSSLLKSHLLFPLRYSSYRNNMSIFEIDTRTFIVSLAINLGYYTADTCSGDIDNCLQVMDEYYIGPPNNTTFVREFTDPRYPGMENTYCIENDRSNSFSYICSIQIGGFITLPIFNHLGNFNSLKSFNEQMPEFCECGSIPNMINSTCQEWSFLSGFITYPVSSKSNLFRENHLPILRLVQRYKGNYTKLNKEAYRATLHRDSNNQINGEFHPEDFDFCYDNVTKTDCVIISYLSSNFFQKINSYGRELKTGACFDTFSVDDSSWEILKNNPPSSLEENYKKCTKTETFALLEAMGIAVGNVHAISPLFIFLAIQFLFLLGRLGICKKSIFPDDRKFTNKEKSDILDMLSEILLLKLKKKIIDKENNHKSSDSISAVDDISNEIANMMRNEIKNHPKYIQRGSRIFENEIQVELTNTNNAMKTHDNFG